MIAAELSVSAYRIAKVTQVLAKLGYVLTSRGRNGGVELARPAGTFLVGEVVRELEGLRVWKPSTTCQEPFRQESVMLKRIVAEANEAVYAVLNRHAIVDLDDVAASSRAQLHEKKSRPACIRRPAVRQDRDRLSGS